MASPQTPVADSPAPPQDELSAPPGWTKKLVPRKGRGLTPKKNDVIYISPDGEEVKSKTHLQRYLKAHQGGPAISEFNWSSGETPTRRSSRFTSKTPPDTEAEVTPKRAKRNAVEIDQEEIGDDQTASAPSKRAKVQDADSDGKDAGGDCAAVAAASGTGKDETMHDAEQEDGLLASGEDAMQPEAANGDVEVDGQADNKVLEQQGAEENGEDKFVVEENIQDKFVVENNSDKDVAPPEEVKAEQKEPELPEPVSTVVIESVIEPETQAVIESVTEQSTVPLGETKDEGLEAIAGTIEFGEPLEPLPFETVTEAPVLQEPAEFVQESMEPSTNKEEEERVIEEVNHHELDEKPFVRVVDQGHGKSAAQEANMSPDPVGVSN